MWGPGRGVNMLDGSYPFYDTYVCRDDKYVAVGAIEPKFFAEMLRVLGIDPASVPGQWNRERWPELRAVLGAAFRSRTRDEWADAFSGTDACVTPFLPTTKR